MVLRSTLACAGFLAALALPVAGCGQQAAKECVHPESSAVDGGLVCGRPFRFVPDPAQPARFAVRAFAYVTIDLAGVVRSQGTARVLVLLDVPSESREDGGGLLEEVDVRVCHIRFPVIPVPGQSEPTTLELAASNYGNLLPVRVSARLAPAETCGSWRTETATFLIGARLDDPNHDPLPTWPDYQVCSPSRRGACVEDLDGDGAPGATFLVENMPLVDVRDLWVGMRTQVSLQGMPVSDDRLIGAVTLSLDLSVLGCTVRTRDGQRPCTDRETELVVGLHPAVSQLPEPDSPFAAVSVPPTTTCDDLRDRELELFGH